MEVLSIIVWTIKDILGLSFVGLVVLFALLVVIWYQLDRFRMYLKRKFNQRSKQ